MKCIKSLYKSTYKKNAFTNGQTYQVDEVKSKEDEDIIFIIDNENHDFNFALIENDFTHYMYKFLDYFKYVT